ncbi:MAG: type II CAAX endopeptidase family protein [Veillonellales bacterium]
MLSARVTWNLKTVFTIYILRLAVGLILVRLLYPLLFVAHSAVIEITDRLVMIGLVWLVIRQSRGNFSELGVSWDHLFANTLKGIGAGVFLLAISVFSERLYTTVLFLSPSQHPLVAQVEQASSWEQLLSPLFLAGVAAPVAEETFYRLFTFLPFKEKWGLWSGAVASAAIFALMHFNLYWLAEMIVVGVGLALLYYQTGSLLSAVVAHSVINSTKLLLLFYGISLT